MFPFPCPSLTNPSPLTALIICSQLCAYPAGVSKGTGMPSKRLYVSPKISGKRIHCLITDSPFQPHFVKG